MVAVLTERDVRTRVNALSFMPGPYAAGWAAGFGDEEFQPAEDLTPDQRKLYTDGYNVGRTDAVYAERQS